MNITDIDDKIIVRAREQGISTSQLTRKWEQSFFTDMESLGVKKPDCIVRVSEHIAEIVEYIDKIVKRGYGYLSNGSVYFDIERFKNAENHTYPKLNPKSACDSTKVRANSSDSFKREKAL